MSSTNLNPQQYQAVHHPDGPLLVVAGAGSGKTRVITSRILHLIQQGGVRPEQIVALTFTNKAANEMKGRIINSLKNEKYLPFIGTFHSYCVRLLKKYNYLLEHPFVSILDEDDQRKIITGILQRNNIHKQISAKQVSYHISGLKNSTFGLNGNYAQAFPYPLLTSIYEAYEREKQSSKVLDFDDLLLTTVKLFKKNVEFKKEFQHTLEHVLVDEYQDTNIVQHELLKHMTLSPENNALVVTSLCVVGDEDQSIYAWRGANVTNMLHFQSDFKGTTRITIDQNYRSVQPILEVAHAVIVNNTQRNPKKLWSERQATNRVKQLQFLSEYQESDAIAQLAHIVTSQQYNKRSVAILYRTHAQSRAIEEALLKVSVPYTIIGGIQFYERKEIKDLLAYLKLIANPFDRASLFRIINTPPRTLGTKFEAHLYEALNEQPSLSCLDVCMFLAQQNNTTAKKQQAILDFCSIFDGLSPETKPSSALLTIIDRSGYNAYIRNTYEGEEISTHLDNIQELIQAASYFELHNKPTVDHFLQEIALMQEKLAKQNNKEEKVILMTIHAAKGLEFDIVVLAGMEEGRLPTTRALQEDANALEEERRLFYVGITRAKEYLLLTHTQFRSLYGHMIEYLPSQFLDEVPRSLVPKEKVDHWTKNQMRHFFTSWLFPHAPLAHPTIESFKKTAQKTISSHKLGCVWKENQPVHHEKYGVGIIKEVTVKPDRSCMLTIAFKEGIKKIMSLFVRSI